MVKKKSPVYGEPREFGENSSIVTVAKADFEKDIVGYCSRMIAKIKKDYAESIEGLSIISSEDGEGSPVVVWHRAIWQALESGATDGQAALAGINAYNAALHDRKE